MFYMHILTSSDWVGIGSSAGRVVTSKVRSTPSGTEACRLQRIVDASYSEIILQIVFHGKIKCRVHSQVGCIPCMQC